METLWQDVKYAVRRLARSPGFATVAVLSLALGIGANTAIFSLIHAVLLQPVPIQDPERVVSIVGTDASAAASGGPAYDPVSFPNYVDLREQARVFSGAAAYIWLPLSFSAEGAAEQVFGQMVTGNYFEVLGVEAAAGRTFLPEEDTTPGTHPVAVLSHNLWQRRFGADPDVVGRSVRINNSPFTVIGVMPRGFRGASNFGAVDLWVPMSARLQVFAFNQFFDQRRWRLFNLVARLAPGASFEQADNAVKTIGARLQQEHPTENPGRSFTVLRLAETGIDPNLRGTFVRAGIVLFATSILVLLIACANVANLLLARAAARRREMAVRLSLGVTRGRLLRQLLTESLLLAVLSGALGVLIAFWGKGLLWSLRPPMIPSGAVDIGLNPNILAFALLVSALAGLLFGLVPALRASRPEVVSDLKDQAGEREGGRRFGLRSLLVVAQIAISIVALIGAGLFLRSLRKAQEVDTGFKAENLVAVGVNLAAQQYDLERGRQFQSRVVERLSALPEVESVGLAQTRPMSPAGMQRSLLAEGQQNPEGGHLLGINTVDPGYFRTLGIPIVAGRGFAESDGPESPPVAIVNETLARRLWPGGTAVGRRFTFLGEPEPIEVVGVARDSKYRTVSEEPQPYAYMPLRQRYTPMNDILVRTRVADKAALDTVQREMRALDPNLPLLSLETATQTIAFTQWGPRMIAVLLAFFGGLALVLALMGIYSVLAYTVRQRRREIGIRSALGAKRADLLRMILLQALAFVAVGVVLGVAAALAASRVAESLLFGVSANDPLTFAGVPLLLAAVALAASLVPALRAARVEPLIALKSE